MAFPVCPFFGEDRMLRACLLLFFGAFLLTAPALAADEPITKIGTVEGITEYKMSNGLRVLLFPDPSKPLVTVNCTIFVGSRHEGYGETGMAHLLEHMLFKGTPTYPNVPKSLRDHGARFNGTTWVDRTNYYETMPATDENLEFGIKLEADRLTNSYVKREDLISEMTVVRNEFEMGENDPENILKQRMMAVAYEWHNYGKSTIGNRSDIERVPIENLQAFYRRFYQVDNAMLVIAGQFDEKKALEYVVKYFGVLKKPTRKLDQTYTEEPTQDGERLVVLRRVGAVGATGVDYHIPAGAHEDFAALQVLEDCLTAKPAGRLYKALVEGKKAARVSGSAFGWHDPGVIEITAKVEDKEGVDQARDTMIAVLESLGKKPITEEEVNRSKQRFKKFDEETLASSDAFAIQLSEWAGAGDWRLFFLNRDRVETVTPADVNRVAAKYLVPSNRTVGVYYPTAKPERASIPETPNLAKLLDGYKGRDLLAKGESFEPSPANIDKRTVHGELGAIKTAFLPRKTRGEMVEVQLNIRYGNEEVLKGLITAAELMPSMLNRGTAKHTRQQIADTFDKLGAHVSFSGQPTLVAVSIKVKKANLAPTLQLVGEILKEASFPEEEFNILKRERTAAINAQKTEPIPLAITLVRRKLSDYPKDNVRYVPTIEETIERLKNTTLEHVKTVYGMVSAQAGELAAVGDFDSQAIVSQLGPVLKDWKSNIPYKRIDKPAKPIEKGETVTIDTPDKANAVYLAGIAFPMNDMDPDYAAMEVGNYLLGGAPLASRLSNRVRGEKGLSYAVESAFRAGTKDKSASITLVAITNPVNIDKVDALMAEEVGKFLKDGLSLEELEAGKKAFLEEMKVERSEDSALASELANNLFLGRTFAYTADLEKKIESLTPAEIQKAYGKVLDPKKLVIIHAGDLSKKK
jgi:zinc protease